MSSANPKTIELRVPETFQLSDFVKECNPTDTARLIEYGEDVLHTTKQTILNKAGKAQIAKLSQTIQSNQETITQLRYTVAEAKSRRDQLSSELKLNASKAAGELEKEKEKIKKEHEDNLLIIKKKCAQRIADVEITSKEKLESLLRQEQTVAMSLRADIAKERIEISHRIEKEVEKERKLYDRILTEGKAREERLYQELAKERQILIQKEDRLAKRIEEEVARAVLQERNNFEKQLSEGKLREETIYAELQKIIKYYSYENNVVKGAKGENRVEELLKEFYPVAKVENRSGTAHVGDILFELVSHGLKCLVEVKNKKALAKDDVPKFIRDVNENAPEINCGLFISMLSKNIQGKGEFYVEIQSGMPVIYLFLNDNSSLKFAVETLGYLVKQFYSATEESLSEKTYNEETMDLIHYNYELLKTEQMRMVSLIKLHEKQISQLKLARKNLGTGLSKITDYYITYEHMKSVKTKTEEIKEVLKEQKIEEDEDYSSEEIKKLEEWVDKNKSIPIKKEIRKLLGLSLYDMRVRGVKDIRDKLKIYLRRKKVQEKSDEKDKEQESEKLSKYSNIEIQKLKEWITKNNKTPDRSTIMKILKLNQYQMRIRGMKEIIPLLEKFKHDCDLKNVNGASGIDSDSDDDLDN